MFRIKRRRTLIRLLSFITAGFVVTIGLAVTGFWMSYGLRMNIEYSYERSLSDLSDHVDNINLALEKAQYAGTNAQVIGISSQIRTESVAAKTALSQIAVSDVNFESTSKFITQAGDYANTLSHSLTLNQKLSDADRKNLNALYTNSKKLSQQLNDIVSDVQAGRLTLFKSDRALENLDKTKTQSVSTVQSGFQSIENNISGLPTLIYDGPFSDNMLKKNPEYIKGKPPVNREAARAAAAKFLGVDTKAVADNGETGGSLPTYNFTAGTQTIYVSKSGGLVVRMLNSRAPASAKIDYKEATVKVNAFFQREKIDNMVQTYYMTNNNTCVVNCAYTKSGVTCYTDLVKVGIALDTGEVLSYDATGFIMNHKARNFPAAKVKESTAQTLVNPLLSVKKASLALIPRGDGSEVLCYEFKCTADQGKKNIIDYYNVTNGVEEQILILTQTPGGILAM